MSELDGVARALGAHLGDRVARDVPGGALTTYRCGGSLALQARVETEADLEAIAAVLAGHEEVPVLVIGGGSNLLIADTGFAGLAIVLGEGFGTVDLAEAPDRVAGGGAVPLPVLARRTAAAGVTGLEFYVGIPGTVGGAVRMNAGGHGSDTHAVLVEARVFSLHEGTVRKVDNAALGLGYRRSNLDARSVVTAATFHGTPDEVTVCEGRLAEIVRWRREHQPGGQNAGSVFVNPPGDAAGRLIEACGAKGLRIGGAVVSPKHANFFVAEPGATAADVVALIREVQRRVDDAFGIHLEPEVCLVGFDAARENPR